MTKKEAYRMADKKIAEADRAIVVTQELIEQLKKYLTECKQTKKRLISLRNQIDYQ